MIKRVLEVLFMLALMAVAISLSSGRLDWWLGWAYLAVFVGGVALSAIVIRRVHPDLLDERSSMKPNTKSWDKVLSLSTLLGIACSIVVAGLDVRFGWTGGFSLTAAIVALGLVAVGYLVTLWAMIANRFFSAVVRIQTDRGHTVATGGPYRYVRHPGYIGMILTTLLTAPALGSLWALIPAGIGTFGTLLRTALEDATLQAELRGYREYAQRVRYRLLPGLW